MESQVQGTVGATISNNAVPAAGPVDAAAGGDPIIWDRAEPGTGGSNKVLFVLAGAALLIAAGGMVKSMMSPKQEAPAPVASSYFSEQAKMMKDAMSMAREARQMQRERMEMMRQEMEMQEGEYGGAYGQEMGMEDGGGR